MSTCYFDSGGAATNSGSSDAAAPDLNGTATATVVANTTFVDANVNVGANTVNVAAHGYTAGTGVELSSSGTLPAGLTLTTLYFIGVIDANNISFHRFIADALGAANLVDITAAAGGGTHTINNMTLNIAGGVDLSGVKVSGCRVTTTGTSHVFTMLGGIHGFTTGDPVVFDIITGGTAPTGVTMQATYYVNALSTTTFRIYPLPSLAISGGASPLNVSAAEVRTLHVRSMRRDNGGQQSAINLPASTVANRKIFWIRAVDNTNDLIVLDVVVTGLGAGGNWAIGGQLNAAGWGDGIAAVRSNDVVWINTDLSANPLNGVFRMVGAAGLTNGWLKILGKSGARRVLTNQGNGDLLTINNASASFGLYFNNLEMQSQGTGSNLVRPAGSCNGFLDDMRVTDGAALQFAFSIPSYYIDVEISGIASAGNAAIELYSIIFDSYIHDNTGMGLRAQCGFTSAGSWLINSIVERTGGVSISGQGNDVAIGFYGSTVYRGDANGLARANTESKTYFVSRRSIFKDNGNAAAEFNWNLLPNTTGGTDGAVGHTGLVIDRDNILSIDGARGGGNTNTVFAIDTSDIIDDPLFVDPDNGTAANRDFSLQAASPGLIPFSFVGSNIEYTYSVGAIQNQGETPAVVDANITHVNGVLVGGTGIEGDTWGPDTPPGSLPQDVNVVSVNGVTVTGTGVEGDTWGPV